MVAEPLGRLPGGDLTSAERDGLPDGPLPVSSRSPATVAELRSAGLIGDGWEHFEPREVPTAEWLRERDVVLVSVANAERRTPDAVAINVGGGVLRALRNGGSDLDEILVIGDGYAFRWP